MKAISIFGRSILHNFPLYIVVQNEAKAKFQFLFSENTTRPRIPDWKGRDASHSLHSRRPSSTRREKVGWWLVLSVDTTDKVTGVKATPTAAPPVLSNQL